MKVTYLNTGDGKRHVLIDNVDVGVAHRLAGTFGDKTQSHMYMPEIKVEAENAIEEIQISLSLRGSDAPYFDIWKIRMVKYKDSETLAVLYVDEEEDSFVITSYCLTTKTFEPIGLVYNKFEWDEALATFNTKIHGYESLDLVPDDEPNSEEKFWRR